MENNLQEWFGGIDIYIFDQLLKGRFVPGMRVLDAGCGSGRNLVYFLRSGYEVFGVDESPEAISQVRRLASALAPHLPAENFRVEPVERMSWDSAPAGDPPATAGGTDRSRSDFAGFDVVLSSAVLHFARDQEHWQAMVDEMWRVLKPGGIFFARLASTIGMESEVKLIERRRYRLPDGSERFLVDEAMLHRVTSALGGEFIEPIKTTVVENMRAMTTWVATRRPKSKVQSPKSKV
ncbi:MAG: class I SAM-dependent methyltransferase [Acidobacteriota bacterium]|nr:class I SAM-dependent methyltransferase [Acidobacteriota bacterium]